MIGASMLYAAFVGALLTVAAAVAERAARIVGRPARHVWAVALVAALVAPALLLVSVATRGMRPLGAASSDTTATAATSSVRLPSIVVHPSSLTAELDRVLVVGWILASVAGLASCAGGAWRLRRLRRGWPAVVVDGVAVRVSDDVGPAALGVRRAEVVLPRWALALPPAQRTLVLAHERAHADARDPGLLVAATTLVWLAPWNPALWFALARLRAAIEIDCDARVLDAHPKPFAYASLLLDVSARALDGLTPFPLPPALTRSGPLLARRIAAMSARRSPLSPLRAAAVAACALVTLGLTAAAASTPRPATAAAAHERTPGAAQMRDTAHAYKESEVDTPAGIVSLPSPHYPDTLKAAKVEGTVLLQFVVDTAGRAEPRTMKVLQSSNGLFTQAALAALDSARFKPAIKRGRSVRQMVQLPFQFALK